jgi:DNA-binding response OmpR family regulator
MREAGTPAHRPEAARTVPEVGGERRQLGDAPAKATVLVVDDDNAIRDFLRSALESEGYAVLAAGDGVDALALCERYPTDVILLDLMMPRMGGLAFLARYRQLHGPDGVAVYVMSAVRAAVEQAAAQGVAGTFVKPFDLDELLDTLGAAVERRGRERLSSPRTTSAPRTRRAPARLAGKPR